MMRKVVDDGNSVNFGYHLQAALHAAKFLQGRGNRCFADAVVGRQGSGGGSVQHIVFACQRKLEVRPGVAVVPDAPAGQIRSVLNIGDSPVGTLAKSIALDPAEGAAHALVHVGMTIPCDQPPTVWDKVHQTLERNLHLLEAVVDVGVVEFHRSENSSVREIVQELRPFIEEGGVVFIAFQDELVSHAQRKRAAKVLGNSADQEARGASGMMEEPCQQRGRGRLAVRPGDPQPLLAG